MKNIFLKLRTTLKIKGWYLKNKIFKCTLSLTPSDKLTLVAFMYALSEKGPNLQEWTPAEWLSAGGVLYLVWALLITDKLSLAEEKLARYDELSQKVATTLEQIKELNRALATEKEWSARQLHESYLEKERAIREADLKNARLKAKIEILEAQLTKQSGKEMISSENDSDQ